MNKQSAGAGLRKSTGRSLAVSMIGALTIMAVFVFANRPVAAAEITVYKSPSCGCCGAWVDHLKQNGFDVEVRETDAMQAIKDSFGVPGSLRSCHTAQVGGYLIEGHVPADSIRRLLSEKPAIKGLAVPGMPMGSPGMEGPRSDPYDVVGFSDDGEVSVFQHYQP